MGRISPIMGLYGYVGNFQPVFVAKPAKFPAQKYRRNLDDFRKQMLSPKCLVWNESWSLAESEYVIGFTIKRHQTKKQPRQVTRLTVLDSFRKK